MTGAICFPTSDELLAAAYFALHQVGKAPTADEDMRPLLAEAEKHLVQFRDSLIMEMADRTCARLSPAHIIRIWPKVYDLLIERHVEEVWLNPDDADEAEAIPLACAYGLAGLRWLNWMSRGVVPEYSEMTTDYAADFVANRRYLPQAPAWWVERYHKPVQARLL